MDLKKNEGEVSFAVTVLFRQVLIKLTYVLCKKVTGQFLEICSLIAKYQLKIFFVVRRAREVKLNDLKFNNFFSRVDRISTSMFKLKCLQFITHPPSRPPQK